MRRVRLQQSAVVFAFCTTLLGCPGTEETPDTGILPTEDTGTLAEDTGARDAGRDAGPIADAGTDAFVVCTATEFRNATGTCTALTVCTATEYESTAATPTSDRACTALTVCAATEYESTAATPTSNRACTALTVCAATEYESTAATPTSNRACTALTTCTDLQYQMVAPTPTSDRVCAAVTACTATEYETTAPTATTNRVCRALTVCTATQYQTTAPTATTNRVCTALTVCDVSQYQTTAPTPTTDRVCRALTVCIPTQQQTVAPTATSDRACAPCGAGTASCDLNPVNGCEVNTTTSSANCGGCGIACALDRTCGGSTCSPCTPVIVSLPASSLPSAPAGTGARCFVDNGSAVLADCQVLQCGQLNTWALSYGDNRNSFDVVTYTPAGTIVRQTERTGARYWWSSAINAGPQTVTLYGQGPGSVTIPWSDLRL